MIGKFVSCVGFSYYNIQPYHAVPASVNVMSNAFAQAYLNDTNTYVVLCLSIDLQRVPCCVCSSWLCSRRIYTYNHPLPKTLKSQLNTLQTGPTALNLALLTIIGLGFMQASFAVIVTSVCCIFETPNACIDSVLLGACE